MRDEFFWLSTVNKATLVINSREGLLTSEIARKAADALRRVVQEAEADTSKRAKTYITFEPLLLKKAGAEITLMHAGRSSQDIHATFRSAILRDEVLNCAEALALVCETLTGLADAHQSTIVPNYTNGVAAQPNSVAHYYLGFLAGFSRDAQRLHELYERLDCSPMGSAVLNGTCWPLNRTEMARFLGFSKVADNAYDATQISQSDLPVEFAQVITAICLHITTFLEDLMIQYAQSRPWILLQEGGENTYVSSAMPQKRNPGLVNNTRCSASNLIGEAQGEIFRAHNLQSGMIDPKNQTLNRALGTHACEVLGMFNRVLKALVINKSRALEELNRDWTASQELADRLMKDYGVPFRVGHHAASKMVSYAKEHGLGPLELPYETMAAIYREVIESEFPEGDPEFPMEPKEWKQTLEPASILLNKKTQGSASPSEIVRMLEEQKELNQKNAQWIGSRKDFIDGAIARLEENFAAL